MSCISIYVYDATSTTRYRYMQLVAAGGSYPYPFTDRLQHETRPHAVTHSLQLCTPPARFADSSTMQLSSHQCYSSDLLNARVYVLYTVRVADSDDAATVTSSRVSHHRNEPTSMVITYWECTVDSEPFAIASVLACTVLNP